MANPFKQAVLKKKVNLTHDVIEMIFEVDASVGFTFQPGQYVTIKVPQEEAGPPIMRSYSIASSPSKEGQFELCVKLIPEGLASEYFKTLEEGDEITFIGPVGRFLLQDTEREKVFIATGTGIAPFKAMLEVLMEKNAEMKTSVLFGVRHEKDLFYEEFFKTCSEKLQFHLEENVSRPEGECEKCSGRVTSCLSEHFEYTPNQEFYICGNGSMIDSVKDVLLEKGVQKEHIHYEKYNNV